VRPEEVVSVTVVGLISSWGLEEVETVEKDGEGIKGAAGSVTWLRAWLGSLGSTSEKPCLRLSLVAKNRHPAQT
jgi:hypothetical protein